MRPVSINIDFDALNHNLEVIKAKVNQAKIVAMVKANAYGHGLKTIAQALDGQVDALGVACIEEAKILKEAGVKAPILLAEGCFTQDEYEYVEQHQLYTVIHNEAQLKQFLSIKPKKPISVWLKLDSGMNTLIDDALQRIKMHLSESISPYTRFVKAEEDALLTLHKKMESGIADATRLRRQINKSCES